MPERERIVINTGPLIAVVAALGDLDVLESLYRQVIVPFEVCQEMLASGPDGFAVAQFENAHWLHKWQTPIDIAPILLNSLDLGEVPLCGMIQLALNEKIPRVCIDETAGRRIARLSGLSLTGSIGILLRANKKGYPFSMRSAVQRMREKGIWLSESRCIGIAFALHQTGEDNPA
jgi:predicted nucleic acid-binding protein